MERGWSISIGDTEVLGVSGFAHTVGMVVDPNGTVFRTFEVQPSGGKLRSIYNGESVINFGTRDGDTEALQNIQRLDIATNLTRSEAQSIAITAEQKAIDVLQGQQYQIPPSVENKISTGIAAWTTWLTGGSSAEIEAIHDYAGSMHQLLSGLDPYTQNSGAGGRIFHDEVIAQASQISGVETNRLSYGDFENAPAGWDYPMGLLDSQGSLRRFPLSQFHQFFSECFGGCSPSEALSGCAVQAVTNRLHISI